MSRRRQRRKKPRRPSALPASAYRRNVRQADEVLSRNSVEIRVDNWQQLAVDWFAPEEPERGMLARYIADHQRRLGVPWARVFYNRGLVRYFLDGDRKTAIADIEEALRRKPDYTQAKEALRGLRGRVRWVPW